MHYGIVLMTHSDMPNVIIAGAFDFATLYALMHTILIPPFAIIFPSNTCEIQHPIIAVYPEQIGVI